MANRIYWAKSDNAILSLYCPNNGCPDYTIIDSPTAQEYQKEYDEAMAERMEMPLMEEEENQIG